MKHPSGIALDEHLVDVSDTPAHVRERFGGRVLTAELPPRHQRAVLVQNDPRLHERGRGEVIGEAFAKWAHLVNGEIVTMPTHLTHEGVCDADGRQTKRKHDGRGQWEHY
jgi:hypothetical protein